MRAVDLIEKKRNKEELSKEEISFLLNEYLKGNVPDYQMSAFLMATYFNDMTPSELLEFTMIMRDSGDTVKFDDVEKFLVDKHSTGGVGDKVTVVLAPILSALGILKGKQAICFPECKSDIEKDGAIIVNQDVVKDDNIITSRGAGTAIDFSLALIEELLGKNKSEEIRKQILYK